MDDKFEYFREVERMVWRNADKFKHPVLGVAFPFNEVGGADIDPDEVEEMFIVDEVDAMGQPAHLIRYLLPVIDGDTVTIPVPKEAAS